MGRSSNEFMGTDLTQLGRTCLRTASGPRVPRGRKRKDHEETMKAIHRRRTFLGVG